MASSLTLKLTCLVLLCLAVSAPVARAAVTCGQVTNSLAPCVSYVTNKGPLTPACCAGIKSLNSAAQTAPDRQAACSCLKSAAGSIQGVNYGVAGGLPGKCGVSIPYPISPNTDCSKVN